MHIEYIVEATNNILRDVNHMFVQKAKALAFKWTAASKILKHFFHHTRREQRKHLSRLFLYLQVENIEGCNS